MVYLRRNSTLTITFLLFILLTFSSLARSINVSDKSSFDSGIFFNTQYNSSTSCAHLDSSALKGSYLSSPYQFGTYATWDSLSWQFDNKARELKNIFTGLSDASILDNITFDADDTLLSLNKMFIMRRLGATNRDILLDVSVDNDYIYAVGKSISDSGSKESALITKFFKDDLSIALQKTYEGSLTDYFEGVAVDSSFVYAVGRTKSEGSGNFDALIVKYNKTSLSPVIKKVYGGSDKDYFKEIYIDDDFAYAVGYTLSEGFGGNDGLIIKFNLTSLEIVARKIYGGISDEFFYNIDGDYSNLYVVGSTYSEGSGADDALIVMFTKDKLSLLSKKIVGGVSGDNFYSVHVDDTHIYCAGYSYEKFGSTDGLLISFTKDLDIVAKKVFGGENQDIFNSITGDNSNIFISGETLSEDIGVDDALFLIFSKPNLSKKKFYVFGNTDTEKIYSTAFSDNYLYYVGYSKSQSLGEEDALIVAMEKNMPTGTFTLPPNNFILKDSLLNIDDSSISSDNSDLDILNSDLTLQDSSLTHSNSVRIIFSPSILYFTQGHFQSKKLPYSNIQELNLNAQLPDETSGSIAFSTDAITWKNTLNKDGDVNQLNEGNNIFNTSIISQNSDSLYYSVYLTSSGDNTPKISSININYIPKQHITVQRRSSQDNITWTEWTNNITSSPEVVNESAEFGQILFHFSSEEENYSPCLNQFSFEYFQDIIPPRSLKFLCNSTESVLLVNSTLNCTFQCFDDKMCQNAWLSTNEKGFWYNYTDSTYNSPAILTLSQQYNSWFIWGNSSLQENENIQLKVFFNDTSGNTNVTKTIQYTFVTPTPSLTPGPTSNISVIPSVSPTVTVSASSTVDPTPSVEINVSVSPTSIPNITISATSTISPSITINNSPTQTTSPLPTMLNTPTPSVKVTSVLLPPTPTPLKKITSIPKVSDDPNIPPDITKVVSPTILQKISITPVVTEYIVPEDLKPEKIKLMISQSNSISEEVTKTLNNKKSPFNNELEKKVFEFFTDGKDTAKSIDHIKTLNTQLQQFATDKSFTQESAKTIFIANSKISHFANNTPKDIIISSPEISSPSSIEDNDINSIIKKIFKISKKATNIYKKEVESIQKDIRVTIESKVIDITFFNKEKKKQVFIKLTISNEGDQSLDNSKAVVIIPKTLASSIGAINFEKMPEIVEIDPIVYWEYMTFSSNDKKSISFIVTPENDLSDLPSLQLALFPEMSQELINMEDEDEKEEIKTGSSSEQKYLIMFILIVLIIITIVGAGVYKIRSDQLKKRNMLNYSHSGNRSTQYQVKTANSFAQAAFISNWSMYVNKMLQKGYSKGQISTMLKNQYKLTNNQIQEIFKSL